MRRDFIYFFFLFYPFCLHAQKWLPVGSGMDGDVYCFEFFDNNLYAGGWFSSAGSIPASSIARWNGADWDSVGSGVCCVSVGWPKAMEVYNGELYAAGFIPQMGGVSVYRSVNPLLLLGNWHVGLANCRASLRNCRNGSDNCRAGLGNW